ncbi:MAG TPA: hypothetical protein VFB82_07910 [Blastocatellia bacterium]|nr:hypothetical protein [Blastocatellia bacterium]
MKRTAKQSSMVFVLGVSAIILSAFVTASSGQVKKGTPTEAPAAQVATAIGVQDHEVEGVEVALLEVKRASGNTVTIRWQYRNKTNEKKPLNHGANMGMDSYRFAKDVYFLDPSGKKYVPLMDDQGKPIAAKHDQFVFALNMSPKQTVTTWAKFPAPPAEVEKVNVYLPGAPPFEDIALGK